MNEISLKNDQRKMVRASVRQAGIEVTFEDGIAGIVSYSEIPEIKDISMIQLLELPNPFEIKVLLRNQEEIELPWDFVRHFCDNGYKPEIGEVAAQGRKALGSVIRQIRERHNMSQKELAKIADISRATAVRIENGDHSPRYSTLQSIAGALKTTVTDLLSGNTYDNFENTHDYREASRVAEDRESTSQEGTKTINEQSARMKLEEALTRANNGEWRMALDSIREVEYFIVRVVVKEKNSSMSHYNAKQAFPGEDKS